MDYHVILSRVVELVMQVIDGQLVIVQPMPPAPAAPASAAAHPAE